MAGSAHLLSVSLRGANLLLAFVWQGVLLALATALGLRFAARLSAAGRSRVLAAVLVAAVALVFVPLLPYSAGGSAAVARVHLRPIWAVLASLVWVMAAVYRGISLGWGALRVRGIARRATPLTATPEITALLQGARGARLYSSAEVDRPSVTGLWRPRVLLPEGLLERLSGDEAAQVILHEREHLRRYDDWWNTLQQVSLAAFPLHPALLWLNRRMARERELACDDEVLRATRARVAYASCLVKIAEDSMLRRRLDFALSLLGSRARSTELMARVHRILGGAEGREISRHTRLAARAGLGLAVLSGVCFAVARPSLVSFDRGETVVPLVARADGASALVANGEPSARVASTAFPGVRPARFTPASELRQAGPMLTRAVLTEAKAQPLHEKVSSRTNLSRGRIAGRSHVSRTTTQPPFRRLAESVKGPRVVLTRFPAAQTIYAAVPWQGGWLLVQL